MTRETIFSLSCKVRIRNRRLKSVHAAIPNYEETIFQDDAKNKVFEIGARDSYISMLASQLVAMATIS